MLKSPTVQSAWKNRKRSVYSVVRQKNEREHQGSGVRAETMKKVHKNKLEVAEMRMLRWMCGVAKLDKIINERIRTTKVVEIEKKVQERRLKQYGHVVSTEEHSLTSHRH